MNSANTLSETLKGTAVAHKYLCSHSDGVSRHFKGLQTENVPKALDGCNTDRRKFNSPPILTATVWREAFMVALRQNYLYAFTFYGSRPILTFNGRYEYQRLVQVDKCESGFTACGHNDHGRHKDVAEQQQDFYLPYSWIYDMP